MGESIRGKSERRNQKGEMRKEGHCDTVAAKGTEEAEEGEIKKLTTMP